MKLVKLGSFVLVAAMAAGSVGCVVRAHGHARVGGPVVYVEEEPPPPKVWIVETRPGFVYIQGRWTRSGRNWVWRDGYWERQRANQVWVDGRWERRGNRHVWVDGTWRAGGGASVNDSGGVRDHRRGNPPPPPQDNGPVIRDHRRR